MHKSDANAGSNRFRRDTGLERSLVSGIEGSVHFDAFTRGRYATDASIYQIMPAGVVIPKTAADVEACLKIARKHGVPVIVRGAGTSQNGQAIGQGLIVDFSRHLNSISTYDAATGTITVEPGMVLERLNTRLRADGWFFPVEPSTASRCTIGGMTGNNSCGARSIRYGKMADNVVSIDGLFHDGEAFSFGPRGRTNVGAASERAQTLSLKMLGLANAHRDEILRVYPKVQRRVGGYNLDALIEGEPNLARLLVGSEGTLAVSTAVTLSLSRLPRHRVMGVCHFPGFRPAMETTRHLVELGPVAVELADRNVLDLGANIPLFRRILADITKGEPECLLLVEFAGEDLDALKRDLKRLDQCMSDHGFPDAVVEVLEPGRQRSIWDMRESCMNIMMSMKGDGKPVSFIEDCAVPLEHLADYTSAINDLFERSGTRGTWYAHASVGCLHVRPILNMKSADDIKRMRAIAEGAVELVRKFKGSYSGEHGDGISRSEFIAPMFGEKITAAFGEVKAAFDPDNRLNPGKIVDPPRFDDRTLLRFFPDYRATEPAVPALDWSAWGGFPGAVEMCNNNGACRSQAAGVMCPSWRVTHDETHVTRGRANVLRLAISGQLGPDALGSPQLQDALDLCVGCKGCRRECPTGVDMARMKIEVQYHVHKTQGLGLQQRLIAYLPRYAKCAAALRWLLNLRDVVPGAAKLSEKFFGFSARRSLPIWRKPWTDPGHLAGPGDVAGDGRDLVIFADTFNRYFEPANLSAAHRVLKAAGYRIHNVAPSAGARPLCCGRTFLSTGLVDEARAEVVRVIDTLLPFVKRGARIVGLEPSCLLTLQDEALALGLGQEAVDLAASTVLFEDVLATDLASGKVRLPVADQSARIAHLHGHCHQKAFERMGAVEAVLRAVPGLEVRPIESSCCGMAGAFGYEADHHDVSVAMAELSLFPALRKIGDNDLIVADGTSCRHQITDGVGRKAVHVARVLEAALAPARP
jgi:FAD/FMN-containing dehydrogenase/Fe-S oxidoreductase